MALVAFLEVLLVLRASWMWQEGIAIYGLEAGLRVVGDIFLIVVVLAISSTILDRFGDRWIAKEIDERAGEVTALTRQFKKLDSQWRWEGNTLTREVKKSFKQDFNDMKTYCIRYRHFRFTDQMMDAMKWAYKLGYYRASLESEQIQKEQAMQQKQREEEVTLQVMEESKRYQRQVEQQYRQEFERWKAEQEAAAQTVPSIAEEIDQETEEEKVIRYLRLGRTGKEIAEELGFSPAKVSRIRKKALQDGLMEE